MASSCHHGTENWSSIKHGEFLEWLSDCHLFKNISAPWNCIAFRAVSPKEASDSSLKDFSSNYRRVCADNTKILIAPRLSGLSSTMFRRNFTKIYHLTHS
jgi:hypothetical protein